jgi:hypothetical protein
MNTNKNKKILPGKKDFAKKIIDGAMIMLVEGHFVSLLTPDLLYHS